jgi:hypothetical protein
MDNCFESSREISQVDHAVAERSAETREAPRSGVRIGDAIAQAKLSVGPAGDRFEREADDVAARVVRALRSGGPASTDAEPGSRVQRSTHAGRDTAAGSTATDVEDSRGRVQRASHAPPASVVGAGIGRIQRSAMIGAEGGDIDQDTTRLLNASRSSGKPLPEPARSKMEGAFGADFSTVRVNVGSSATELNSRIQAKAFTTGQDIYFRDGLPDVSTTGGQSLLAHELTHTIQQGAERVRRSSSTAGGVTVAPSDVQRLAIQRVFSASNPSTYDHDGGHGLAQHGPLKPESEHTDRAKTNAPKYASSGWASESLMQSAVTRSLATRSEPGAKLSKTPTSRYYKRWTVNVTLPKCGYTWASQSGSDPVTKTEVGTAVVIFGINENDGNIEKLVTAFPGPAAVHFNATA